MEIFYRFFDGQEFFLESYFLRHDVLNLRYIFQGVLHQESYPAGSQAGSFGINGSDNPGMGELCLAYQFMGGIRKICLKPHCARILGRYFSGKIGELPASQSMSDEWLIEPDCFHTASIIFDDRFCQTHFPFPCPFVGDRGYLSLYGDSFSWLYVFYLGNIGKI